MVPQVHIAGGNSSCNWNSVTIGSVLAQKRGVLLVFVGMEPTDFAVGRKYLGEGPGGVMNYR